MDPHQIPGQPKPRKAFGIVYNTTAVLFWGFVFFVPPAIMIAWNGFRFSMPPEELLKTRAATSRVIKEDEEAIEDDKRNLNRVMFEANDSANNFRQGWAIKRDEQRAALELAKQEELAKRRGEQQ